MNILGIATLFVFLLVMLGAWLLIRRAPGADDEFRKNRAEMMRERLK